MAIDANDVKILIHSSLKLLMKCCWQCLKGHPIISVFLLLLLLFYIFLPSLFNVLFYTSPLAIFTAILLQGRIRFSNQNIKTVKADDGNNNATVDDHGSPQNSVAPRRKLRPTIRAAMSRRTFKKRTWEETGTPVMADLKDDFFLRSLSDETPMKLQEENAAYGSNYSVSLLSNCKEKGEAEKPESSASDPAKINGSQKSSCEVSEHNSESQEDDETEAQNPQEEKSKFVVEWTEDDQRNLMDLGSSDIERNKRLENLIAKRRARKLFSMLPQRTPITSIANDLQGHVTSILIERSNSDTDGQPGSAPSVLLPKRNPFDLPYDPTEEKPVLTGDGFEEEFLVTQPKDKHCSRHESFTSWPPFVVEHVANPPSKSGSCVFSNSIVSDAPGLPSSRRNSERENVKQISEELSQEGENGNQNHELLSQEVQLRNIRTGSHEEDNTSFEKDEAHRKLVDLSQHVPVSHEEIVAYNAELVDRMLLKPGDTSMEQGPEFQEEERENALAIESIVSARDEPEMNPALIEDDNDETSSTSSLEETTDVTTTVKNEAFRNSVRKVLACLAQKNRGVDGGERIVPLLYPPPASYPFDVCSPSPIHPTKMEERSFYTKPSHHPSFSIASDMLVEVSESGSPVFNDEPNSPTDRESLVFDGNEDGDVNSGDEDLWGGSTDSFRLEESGTKSRVLEAGDLNKSLFGSTSTTNDHTSEGASSSANCISALPEKGNAPTVDLDHNVGNDNREVLREAYDSRSTISSSRELVDYPSSGQVEYRKQNLYGSQDTDVDSTNAEEQMVPYTWEPNWEESEKISKPSTSTLEKKDENPVLVDYDEYQHATRDVDCASLQSSCGSVSPVTHQASVAQQVARDSGAAPTVRLLENVPVVGSASTSTEQNIDTYIHLPSNNMSNEDRQSAFQDGGDSALQLSFQASIAPSVESELVAEPEVLDLSSSPRSVLQETIAMDDDTSTNSEHNNIYANIQTFPGPIQNPPSVISPTMELELAANRGSVTASSSSPKSVLPETILVHEFATSCERSMPTDIHQYDRAVVQDTLSDVLQGNQQTAPPDEDSGPTRSSINSVSPGGQVPGDPSSSANSVLPQTFPLDEMALRSDRVVVENISLSDIPQEDQGTAPPDEDSGPTRSSISSALPRTNVHFDAEQVLTDPPLPVNSVTPPTVPLDEIALRSSESIHSNIQPFDGVLVTRIPLQDLPLAEHEKCLPRDGNEGQTEHSHNSFLPAVNPEQAKHAAPSSHEESIRTNTDHSDGAEMTSNPPNDHPQDHTSQEESSLEKTVTEPLSSGNLGSLKEATAKTNEEQSKELAEDKLQQLKPPVTDHESTTHEASTSILDSKEGKSHIEKTVDAVLKPTISEEALVQDQATISKGTE